MTERLSLTQRIAFFRCRWLGHARRYHSRGTYFDRHGRERDSWCIRCLRCGAEDYEAHEEGFFERMVSWPRGARIALRRWVRADCTCCGKPERRFGLPVGDHAVCDDIPF